MFPSKTNVFLTLALAGVLSGGVSAQAAEYLFKPRVGQRFGYDGNLRLGERFKTESFSYELEPGLELEANADNWRVSGDASLAFRRFEEDDFNTDDQFGLLSIGNFTPIRQLQLVASIDRESLRTSEQESTGVVDPTRVERIGLRPVGYWQLSERNGLTIGASFTNVHYENTRFDDYKNYAVDATWAHQFTERFLFEVTAFGSDYQSMPLSRSTGSFTNACSGLNFSFGTSPTVFLDSTTQNRDSRTFGVEFGVRRAVNEALEWSLTVGGRDVENENKGLLCFGTRLDLITVEADTVDSFLAKDDDRGFIGRTGIKYTGKKFRSELELERSVSPAGLGFLLETTRLDASARYRLREHLDVGLRFIVSESDSLSNTPYNRDLMLLTINAEWKLSERWRAVLGARAREQETGSVLQTLFVTVKADSAAVFVELNYTPQPIQVSR